jgi:hypothetical protein
VKECQEGSWRLVLDFWINQGWAVGLLGCGGCTRDKESGHAFVVIASTYLEPIRSLSTNLVLNPCLIHVMYHSPLSYASSEIGFVFLGRIIKISSNPIGAMLWQPSLWGVRVERYGWGFTKRTVNLQNSTRVDSTYLSCH